MGPSGLQKLLKDIASLTDTQLHKITDAVKTEQRRREVEYGMELQRQLSEFRKLRRRKTISAKSKKKIDDAIAQIEKYKKELSSETSDKIKAKMGAEKILKKYPWLKPNTSR
jgi:polyribonucleotide nucleotidyltransferase